MDAGALFKVRCRTQAPADADPKLGVLSSQTPSMHDNVGRDKAASSTASADVADKDVSVKRMVDAVKASGTDGSVYNTPRVHLFVCLFVLLAREGAATSLTHVVVPSMHLLLCVARVFPLFYMCSITPVSTSHLSFCRHATYQLTIAVLGLHCRSTALFRLTLNQLQQWIHSNSQLWLPTTLAKRQKLSETDLKNLSTRVIGYLHDAIGVDLA